MPKDVHDFKGEKIQFVQVGLGTNSTFIQNLAGRKKDWDASIHSLLTSTSERQPDRIQGIAVEPIAELVDGLRHCMVKLPGVVLVQAALGESDSAEVDIQTVTPQLVDALADNVEPARRTKFVSDLQYLLNMSCIGGSHPYIRNHFEKIEREYNLKMNVQQRKAQVWTWDRLASTYNFTGCEVLLIDTEGNDTAILRSMVAYCRKHPQAWPHLIQFESMGLCDSLEGDGAEFDMMWALEREGYSIVNWSYWNTHLVRRASMNALPRLRRWVNSWFCSTCKVYGVLPYYSNSSGIHCRTCIRKFYREAWGKKPKVDVFLKPAEGISNGSHRKTHLESQSKRVKLTPRRDCIS